MSDPEPCTRRTLATGDLARIEQCSCGAIHLTIGAATLRLSPAAFPSVAATIADATRQLSPFDAWLSTRTRAEVLS